jgi:hypothetical protein
MNANTRRHDPVQHPVQPIGLKTYQKPVIVKGPVLSSITAQPAPVSNISSDFSSNCWVARAAFGETDVRWLIFRAWLLEDAPVWFRRLYIRHGELVGTWVASRDGARRIVRTLMTPAINRKLRG